LEEKGTPFFQKFIFYFSKKGVRVLIKLIKPMFRVPIPWKPEATTSIFGFGRREAAYKFENGDSPL